MTMSGAFNMGFNWVQIAPPTPAPHHLRLEQKLLLLLPILCGQLLLVFVFLLLL